MMTIQARNVNEALYRGVIAMRALEKELTAEHVVAPRGMRTLEYPEPVATTYNKPQERVLFSAVRDANPFFHFFESLWMLSGRRDVAFVEKFNKRMRTFSDNGTNFHAAYGHRWREAFGVDQLRDVVTELRRDPTTRRVVLQMWSCNLDLGGVGKDLPCNTHVYFKVRNGALNMTVCCRSNDMLWGAYGANAVHLSMLQEYIAGKVGVEVGVYTQVSDSFHVYLDEAGGELWMKLRDMGGALLSTDHYELGDVAFYPIESGASKWDEEMKRLMSLIDKDSTAESWNFEVPFFREVAAPMWEAWRDRKDTARWTVSVEKIQAEDWRLACRDWLLRRDETRLEVA